MFKLKVISTNKWSRSYESALTSVVAKVSAVRFTLPMKAAMPVAESSFTSPLLASFNRLNT